MTPATIARASGLVIGLFLSASTANADVTLEEVVRVDGAGLMKVANMSVTAVTQISGNRSRTDSETRMDSGMMRMIARVGPTAQIVQLDKDLLVELDLKKKRYKELSLAAQREEMQKAMAQSQEAQQSQRQTVSGVDESQCTWSEPKANVVKSGEKQSLAGYQAERVTLTATQACTDRKTGQVCEFGLVLDQWITPEFRAADEVNAYQRAYAEKMGFGTTGSGGFAERAEAMFGGYEGIWKEIASKMKDVKGYPLKSSFALGIGGPQCRDSQTPQGTTADDTTPAKDVGRAIGGTIGGAIGGLFGRKKDDAAETNAQSAAPATIANGLIPLLTVSSEITRVNQAAIAADRFEVPPGFKKSD